MNETDAGTDEERIARLERRVDRERSAREEAERIAEEGMRALYEANVQLDRRIAERTAELDDALAAAKASSEALRAVLVGLSHSLATPLNGVRGMLEMLEDSATEEPAKGWHASATRSALRLDRLVQRLVRHVEIENVDLRAKLQPATVRDVLFGLEERWRTALAGAGQLLVVDGGPAAGLAIGTSEELVLALDELLENVREHADPGQVRLTSTLAGDDRVRLELTDPGPGYPSAGADSPSERLARSGDHGSQLGLVLVGRIAEGLGGRFVRDPERPSTAMLELPLLSSA